MTVRDADDRWQEIRDTHQRHKFFYQIGGGVVLVTLGVLIGATLFAGDAGYTTNLYTELLSIGVTVFVLDLLARRREAYHLKQRLIRQLRSTDNGLALQAVEELWAMNAFRDGSLHQCNLYKAKLEGAFLKRAQLEAVNLMEAILRNVRAEESNFRGAGFGMADLQGARLMGANLQNTLFNFANQRDANLESADLKGVDAVSTNWRDAVLRKADLRGARLERADLCSADLINAALRGASLIDADLEGTDLFMTLPKGVWWTKQEEEIEFVTIPAFLDEYTWLPDKTRYRPELGVEQLLRFTGRSHAEFWRSDNPHSPAYSGKARDE